MHRSSKHAFTLIELTIVVLIIFMMVGVVLASTGRFEAPYYKTRSAARQTAGNMERARARAAMTGDLVRIEYDLDRQTMILKVPRTLEEGDDRSDYDIEEILKVVASSEYGNSGDPDSSRVWLDSVQTYDGKTYDQGVVIIDVKATGTPIGHVVHVRNMKPRNEDEEFMSVELNPLTGIATVYEGFREVLEPIKDFN